MQHFPQTRRRFDIVIIVLGIAAIGMYAMMKSYWVTPDFPTAPSKTSDRVVDSVLRAAHISPDTVSVQPKPNINTSLISAIVDTTGTYNAKQYIDKYRLPIVSQVFVIQKYQHEEVNFKISTSEVQSKKNRAPAGKHFLKLEISLLGDIVAFEKRAYLDSMLNQQDTATLLATLLPHLPPQYQSGTYIWKNEPMENGYSFVATVGSFPYHTEKIHLTAIHTGMPEPTLWLVGWEKEYVPVREFIEEEGRYSTFKGVVGVLVVLFLIGFIGVFIAQMRKKAVSIIFTLVASVCVTLYFVSVTLAFSGKLPLLGLILITISMFIFIGFLLGGMPLGGVVSLALEQFPEKFYTIRRWKDHPWKSYFVGRSILLACAITMISACVFPATYWFFSLIGQDKPLQTMVFNGSFFALLQNPLILVSAGLLFVPLTSLAIGLISPALSYRFISPKRRHIGILIGSIVSFCMLLGVQSDPTVPIIIQGVAVGLTYMALFYYTDVLAIAVAAIVNGIIFFIPLAGEFIEVQILFSVILFGFVCLGVIGFIQSPEKVHEQDYKPEYLYRIEEEKRLRDELNAAQVVQRRLLPSKMPVYPMLDVAATCIPAFEVGGDYYDFFPLDDTHLGILIGDVSGKGMSAAFYITLAKGVILSQIQQSLSPADVLCKVNKLLYDTMERGKFISLIYGVFNTATMEFTYAQAGHNPILHRKSDSSTEMLPARGLALGLDSGHVFNHATTNHSVHLDAGDSLILYTDGVTEAVNLSGEEFDIKGLLHSAGKNSADLLALLQAIITDVQTFIGKAKQHDDITLVVIKNNAQPFTSKQLNG